MISTRKTRELTDILETSSEIQELPDVKIYADRLLITLYAIFFVGMFLDGFGIYINPTKENGSGFGVITMLVSAGLILFVPLMLKANILLRKEGFIYGFKNYLWSDIIGPFEVKWAYAGDGNAVTFRVCSKLEGNELRNIEKQKIISNYFFKVRPKLLADVMNVYRERALQSKL
jgi:hypothetical protein